MHPHIISAVVIGGLFAFVIYQSFMAVLDWQDAEDEDDDDAEW